MKNIKNIILYTICALSSVVNAQSIGNLVKDKKVNDLIYYKGTATLSGKIYRNISPETLELMGDNTCFITEVDSKKVAPEHQGNTSFSFCFNDKDTKKLGMIGKNKNICEYSKTATISFTNYVENTLESEVYNTANLVKIINLGNLEKKYVLTSINKFINLLNKKPKEC